MLPNTHPANLIERLPLAPFELEVPEWYREVCQNGSDATSPVRHDERRRFARFYFAGRGTLLCRGNLPTMPRQRMRYTVLCKDVSKTGMSLLHAEPLYPSEEFLLWLPTGMHHYRVRRCRRHLARCFEIGATLVDSQPAAADPR